MLWFAIAGFCLPPLAFLAAHVWLRRRGTVLLRMAPVARGDMVDMLGTPHHAAVQCIDGHYAWCQVLMPIGAHAGQPVLRPMPAQVVPMNRLHVLRRGIAVPAVN